MSETLTITVTNNATGATGTTTVTLATSAPPPPPPGPTPPAQASAAGYNTLVFNDDFTSSSTIATSFSQALTSGVNWYWSGTVGANQWITSGSWSVGSGMAAGSGASPNGGILTLNSVRGSKAGYWGNSTLCTFPGNSQPVGVPAGTSWRNCYFEAYCQTNVVTSPTGQQSEGWPAFWAWSAEGASSFNGGWGGHTQASTEVDILEIQGGVFNDPSGYQAANIFNPGGVTNVFNASYPRRDTNWHKLGCLHAGGNLSFYYDDVLVKTYAAANTNLEKSQQHLFMILGSGINWPFNIDWVRVWQ